MHSVDSRHATTTPILCGGYAFHVLNRAVGLQRLFAKQVDCLAFENAVREVLARQPTRLLSYYVMPNHWHMVVWPRQDGELSELFVG